MKDINLKLIPIIAFILIILIFFSSCRIKYIPMETVKTRTEYKDKLVRDSIYLRDSIRILDKGDTILIEKYKYMWRDRFIYDTIKINYTDTIKTICPVEKELSKWQKLKMDIGGIAIGSVVAIIFLFLIYLIYKHK